MKRFAIISAVAATGALAASAGEMVAFTDVDANGDGAVSESEFVTYKTADGKHLYFSRSTGAAEDIYVSNVTVEVAPDHVDDSNKEIKKKDQKRKKNPTLVRQFEENIDISHQK